MGLWAVGKLKPFNVDGKKAVYEVLLRSNEEDFLNLIKNDAELAEVEQPKINVSENKAQDVPVQMTPSSEIKGQKGSETKQAGNIAKDIAGNGATATVTPELALPAQVKTEENVDIVLSEQRKIYYYRLNRSRNFR